MLVPPDLAPLRNSLQALRATLAGSDDEALMSRLGLVLQESIRFGAIKQFEIAYETCRNVMSRWLNVNVTPGIADGVTTNQLFRLAAESRLIADVEKWMTYHAARYKAAHIYDEINAELVYQDIREFVHDADYLLRALESRDD